MGEAYGGIWTTVHMHTYEVAISNLLNLRSLTATTLGRIWSKREKWIVCCGCRLCDHSPHGSVHIGPSYTIAPMAKYWTGNLMVSTYYVTWYVAIWALLSRDRLAAGRVPYNMFERLPRGGSIREDESAHRNVLFVS